MRAGAMLESEALREVLSGLASVYLSVNSKDSPARPLMGNILKLVENFIDPLLKNINILTSKHFNWRSCIFILLNQINITNMKYINLINLRINKTLQN